MAASPASASPPGWDRDGHSPVASTSYGHAQHTGARLHPMASPSTLAGTSRQAESIDMNGAETVSSSLYLSPRPSLLGKRRSTSSSGRAHHGPHSPFLGDVGAAEGSYAQARVHASSSSSPSFINSSAQSSPGAQGSRSRPTYPNHRSKYTHRSATPPRQLQDDEMSSSLVVPPQRSPHSVRSRASSSSLSAPQPSSIHTSASSSISASTGSLVDQSMQGTPSGVVGASRESSIGQQHRGSTAGGSGSSGGSGGGGERRPASSQGTRSGSSNGSSSRDQQNSRGSNGNGAGGGQPPSKGGTDPSIPKETGVQDKDGVKTVPAYFDDSDPEDIIILVADMLNRLVVHNDQLPLHPSALTRFHSRAVPQISVLSYLRRISKYTSLEKVCCLILLIYIDRVSVTPQGANFTVCSLTVHRFVCAATVCASKALCDAFSTNGHYAKVGGISLIELNMLEKEFLSIIGWNLSCTGALLQQYYTSLVRSHPNYALDSVQHAKSKPSWSVPKALREEPVLASPGNSPSSFPSGDFEQQQQQEGQERQTSSSGGEDDEMNLDPAHASVENGNGLAGTKQEERSRQQQQRGQGGGGGGVGMEKTASTASSSSSSRGGGGVPVPGGFPG